MRQFYIISALFLIAACTKQQIDWDSIDYGVKQRPDNFKNEANK